MDVKRSIYNVGILHRVSIEEFEVESLLWALITHFSLIVLLGGDVIQAFCNMDVWLFATFSYR